MALTALTLCGRPHNGPYVAKLVMWRWPEQPPVPSNRTLVERHISYRVPDARRKRNKLASSSTDVAALSLAIDSRVSPGSGSDLMIDSAPTLVVAGEHVPRLRQAVRVCEEMVMWRSRSKTSGAWASTGWRPHNQLGHIGTEARKKTAEAGRRDRCNWNGKDRLRAALDRRPAQGPLTAADCLRIRLV